MTSLISPEKANNTFVRPEYFFIRGFIGIPNMKYYYVFLLFVYIISVVGNTFVMVIIYEDRNLHTPKYIAVFSLALTDVCESTAQVPKILDVFLFDNQSIAFADCLANFVFVFFFLSMQSFNLAILSYDRLVAICLPLMYYDIMTHRSMLQITGAAWLLSSLVVLVPLGFLTRLSYCKSLVIKSYFCDHGPIFRLACNNNLPSLIISYLNPILVMWLPLFFIIVSYACITNTLLKISSKQDRMKAFKTCTSHLMLVAIFYFPIIFTFLLGGKINANIRILNLSLAAILPPMLNPIIYVLKTEECMQSVKKLLKHMSTTPFRFQMKK